MSEDEVGGCSHELSGDGETLTVRIWNTVEDTVEIFVYAEIASRRSINICLTTLFVNRGFRLNYMVSLLVRFNHLCKIFLHSLHL